MKPSEYDTLYSVRPFGGTTVRLHADPECPGLSTGKEVYEHPDVEELPNVDERECDYCIGTLDAQEEADHPTDGASRVHDDCIEIKRLLREEGPMKSDEIRREMHMSSGQTITRMKRLEDWGDVEKSRAPSDGRVWQYQLTEKGEA